MLSLLSPFNTIEIMSLVESERISLRRHTKLDFNGNYANWLFDEEVMKFTETSPKKYLPNELEQYVKNEEQKGNIFLAVVDKVTGKHIGNLKIYNIHNKDGKKTAEYSRFIGDKSFWGKGYGKELGLLALVYSFEELEIDEIIAACRLENKKAIISNLKIGFNISDLKEYSSVNSQGLARSLKMSLSKESFNNSKGKL